MSVYHKLIYPSGTTLNYFPMLPEGSHKALFTNLFAAPLSILKDAVTEKIKKDVNSKKFYMTAFLANTIKSLLF